MEIKSIRKGRTVKVVTIANVGEVDDRKVIDAAMAATGETRSSLFGTNVTYFDEDDLGLTAVVDLHTD